MPSLYLKIKDGRIIELEDLPDDPTLDDISKAFRLKIKALEGLDPAAKTNVSWAAVDIVFKDAQWSHFNDGTPYSKFHEAHKDSPATLFALKGDSFLDMTTPRSGGWGTLREALLPAKFVSADAYQLSLPQENNPKSQNLKEPFSQRLKAAFKSKPQSVKNVSNPKPEKVKTPPALSGKGLGLDEPRVKANSLYVQIKDGRMIELDNLPDNPTLDNISRKFQEKLKDLKGLDSQAQVSIGAADVDIIYGKTVWSQIVGSKPYAEFHSKAEGSPATIFALEGESFFKMTTPRSSGWHTALKEAIFPAKFVSESVYQQSLQKEPNPKVQSASKESNPKPQEVESKPVIWGKEMDLKGNQPKALFFYKYNQLPKPNTGVLGFFKTNTVSPKHTLQKIIELALKEKNGDERAKKVFEDLGWIKEGKLTSDAPDPIRSAYNDIDISGAVKSFAKKSP